MKIYLLRHGIAEDRKPGRPDSERALTPEGREKLRRVLRRAQAAKAAPSLILTSPYLRAVETAETAAEILGCKHKIIRCEALVPNGSPHLVWEEIKSYAREEGILLSGHEPLMSRMVAYLMGAPSLPVEMKKGALALVTVKRFSADPQGVLRWLLTAALAAR